MDPQLKEQQDLYDRGWRGGLEGGKEQRGNLRTNLDFLSRTGMLKPGDRILEIGCGIGAVVSELAGQGYHVTGTDISQVAIEYGLAKYGDLDLQVQPAEELAFADGQFDVVLSFDLFEHIARIDRHISEVHRVLKSRGYYLFQTPNKYSNATFETLAHRSLKWRRYHPSLHTPGQLRRRLAGHGFDVRFVKMNAINEFTRPKLQKLGPLGSLIARVNFEKLPLVLQTNLYVVAQRKD
ncbi:MAG TPA: class I SAM-dependent methyltransferase [Sedimentisphaerales bacterium]|nr:class I SAM-dependent methyltransferase [Sedimentisphaerales bacterium]HRS12093.1 class I SAM-dependent methyltransferase [Sedimentisphaerales bacterium]HRV48691.1 class I SAM-dependent methyltransferase [Sedimentisphaerales bacterium]